MKINEVLKALDEAMNEGAGAAVTFNFDADKFAREFRGEPADFETDGLRIKVSNLLLSDYDNNAIANDGGYIEFDEDAVKKEAVRMYNEYDRNINAPEITEKDVKSIDEITAENIPNLQFSWGWSRIELPKDAVLSWFEKNNPNGYVPQLEVIMTLNNGEQITTNSVNVDGKYHVSDDVYYAYLDLDADDDEDLNESVDERTEMLCRVYARMLEKINEKFGTLIGTFKVEPLYTDKYELGLKRDYGRYDFKFVSDDAFLPLKNKSLEEQAEYLKGLILGKE